MNPFEENFESEGELATIEKKQVKKPRLFWVILLNDDFTPMEFVILVLTSLFHKSADEATQLMWDVHTKGRGICGLFPFSVAETKAHQVKELAKKSKHPLECIVEPADNQ